MFMLNASREQSLKGGDSSKTPVGMPVGETFKSSVINITTLHSPLD